MSLFIAQNQTMDNPDVKYSARMLYTVSSFKISVWMGLGSRGYVFKATNIHVGRQLKTSNNKGERQREVWDE